MNRYYMTAETRQTLIAESNRLIAARAAANAGRRRPVSDSATEPDDSEWSLSPCDAEAPASDTDSAFARLVADLQGTSVRCKPS